MTDFLLNLKNRNEALFYFGALCLVLGVVFLLLTVLSRKTVNNVNAWYKPFKFALSIALYSWTMAWYCAYLPEFNIRLFNWTVIVLLGFEIVYIALQAGRGQRSHFNISTPLYSLLYGLMGTAASLIALYTAYIGILFFASDFPQLPGNYLWSIRLGIFIFVIFSFQGFAMGSRLTHTIGGADGGQGIPVLNWSTRHGDLRIAHFIGMHALQVLPFLAFYVLENVLLTFALSLVYLLLAVWTFVQAMQGRPLLKSKT